MVTPQYQKNFYLEEVIGYRVNLPKHWYYDAVTLIQQNKTIDPSLIGYFLGLAQPVMRPVICVSCKQKIKSGEEVKGLQDWEPKNLHQACYEKIPAGIPAPAGGNHKPPKEAGNIEPAKEVKKEKTK